MTEPRVAAAMTAERLGDTTASSDDWTAKKRMPAYPVGRLWELKLTEADDPARSDEADETAKRPTQRAR